MEDFCSYGIQWAQAGARDARKKGSMLEDSDGCGLYLLTRANRVGAVLTARAKKEEAGTAEQR